MNKYKIQYSKPAVKFLMKQPKTQQERIYRAVADLPYEGDIKPLAGRDGVFRLRVGDYRVIYTIRDDVLQVLVLTIGNRGDIYK